MGCFDMSCRDCVNQSACNQNDIGYTYVRTSKCGNFKETVRNYDGWETVVKREEIPRTCECSREAINYWGACPNCGESDVDMCDDCEDQALEMGQNVREWLSAMKNGKTEREALFFLYGELPEKVLNWILD